MSGKMKYDCLSANNPDAIARRLNELPDWELITIIYEPPAAYGKPGSYTAFIRSITEVFPEPQKDL